MKKLLTIAALFSSFTCLAQQTQVIKINNPSTGFSVEIGGVDEMLNLDGNAKYYNVWYNQGGYRQDFTNYFKGSIPIHVNGTFEYRPFTANPGILALTLGVSFNMGTANGTYVTKDAVDGHFEKNPETDSIATIKQQFISVPLGLKLRLLKIWGEGIFVRGGVMLDYLANAQLAPIHLTDDYFGGTEISNPSITRHTDITGAFKQITYLPYAGIEFRIYKIFINITGSIQPVKNILAPSVMDPNAVSSKFTRTYTSFSLGYFFK